MTEHEGLNRSLENYVNAAGTLASICQSVTGVPLPETTLTHFKQTMHTIRLIDQKLDLTPDRDQRATFSSQIMEYLKNKPVSFNDTPQLEKSLDAFRSVSTSLPEKEEQSMLRTFDTIFKVTEEIRHTTNVKKLRFLTRLEGQLTSRLFLALIPSEYKESEKYPKVIKALTRMGRVANSYDSFVDLPSDYRAHEVAVKPTLRNRVRLLVNAPTDIYELFSAAPPTPTFLRQISSGVKLTNANPARKEKL